MQLANDKFAAEMRAQIARKQLSSKELAANLGMSYATLNRLLSGKQNWSLDQATRAALLIGLNLSEFWRQSA